jgi:hypothetical protein
VKQQPDHEKPVEGLIRRILFRACDLNLRGEGAVPKVNGRPLTRIEMNRLVQYARKWGFLPPCDR